MPGTPSEAQRLALAVVRSQGLRGPLAERLRRRVLVIGRAAQLGLHLVPQVVLAVVRDHGAPDCWMGRGCAHAIAWLDCEPDNAMTEHVEEVVGMHKPVGIIVTFELRRARWWHRLAAAWLRWRRDRPA